MKKKLLIGTILPALAAAAVIGSGFAYWVFDNTTKISNGTQKIAGDVTQLVQIGNITVADEFTLVFDQKTRPTGFTNLEEGKGIHVEFTGETNETAKNHKATYVLTEAGADNAYVDIVDNQTKVKFTTELEMSADVAAYVNVSYKKTKITPNNGKYTFSFAIESRDATNKSIDWVNDLEFSYVEGKEPTNKDTYDNLKQAVKDSTFKVTYTATIVDFATVIENK